VARQLGAEQVIACDVMICPQVGRIALFDMRQFEGCLAAGEAAVRARDVELARLRARAMPSPASAV
jgi:hypothetical protein